MEEETVAYARDDMTLNRSGLSASQIEWDNPILDQHSLKLRAYIEPTFKYAFARDRTEDFEKWMAYRTVEKRANCVVESIGTTGSGKSYTINTLGFVTDDRWHPHRNVHYSLEGIMSSPHKTESPISWNLDEIKRDWGVGSWRSGAEWENYIESIRKMQHSIFTATPVRKPLGTTMYCLEPIRMSEEHEVVQLALSDSKKNTLGYVIISASWHFMPQHLIDVYEEMKDKYIGTKLARHGEDEISDKIQHIIKSQDARGFAFGVETDSTISRVVINGNRLTTNDVLELVNDYYPHLHRNNEAYTIAEGIKSKLKLSEMGVKSK